ncbi:MAG: glucuronate isomerase [Oscillospiraceae bacterium]|nr:glucuronate isomerase [Oscillospiraceae bacterium]
MKNFMDESFLLQTKTAQRLYESVKDLPIIDWHCHLDPKEIADDKTFGNLTELWLGGDHYKWRAMRACGVDEEHITGSAPDYEKFEKWAETIENCIGNPLYHWTHLELKRVFDCELPLSKKTAKQIWEHCAAFLNKGLKVSQITEKFKVEMICTSDNPIDSLEHHKAIKQNSFKTIVKPTFRPSDLLNIEESGWALYIEKLSGIAQIQIKNYENLKEAAYKRIEFFESAGCNMSDHALDPPVYIGADEKKLNEIIAKALVGEMLSFEEIHAFKTELMVDLGKEYCRRNWTMQLHMGAARSVNSSMTALLGANTGYDCMSGADYGDSLLRLLDRLETADSLPRTILFCLNPKDTDMLTTISGCFSAHLSVGDDNLPKGKVQIGSGWWFNDNKDGMEKQMIAMANNSVLSLFAGMLTDSRSFLSYTRHEYFRRILCNLVGNWVENGEYPADFEKLEEIVKNISYYNARGYFC